MAAASPPVYTLANDDKQALPAAQTRKLRGLHIWLWQAEQAPLTDMLFLPGDHRWRSGCARIWLVAGCR